MTTAVPCWSSWNTGMSSDARNRRSTSKQRGAAMSSRLMPPKPGAIASTAATIASGSFVARQIGQASMPPNSLKSSALPSITGIAAAGPMSPSPSTALPSVTTATVLRLIVRFQTLSGSAAIASHTRATPGVYAIERSSRVFTGVFALMWILPPRCIRNVRSDTLLDVDARHLARGADDRVGMDTVRGENVDVAHLAAGLDPHEVDRVEQAACVGDRPREVGEAPRPVVEADAHREAERGRVGAHGHMVNRARRPCIRVFPVLPARGSRALLCAFAARSARNRVTFGHGRNARHAAPLDALPRRAPARPSPVRGARVHIPVLRPLD